MRRVVVTGLGLLTPLGYGVQENWENLIAGKSGVKKISSFDVSQYPSQIAGIIPRGTGKGEFNPDLIVDPREQRRMDDFIIYGLAAAKEAIEDSGWMPTEKADKDRTGVLVGSGIGGLQTLYEGSIVVKEQGYRRLSPFFIPSALINLVSGHISIKYGFSGPNSAVVTACATGTHAIGDAARIIMHGDADVMIAGGAENPVCELGLAGFTALRALSTGYNENPEKGSRPWDKNRDGFVMGEGAGILVLEEYEHAKARGAKIYAEVVGFGMSGDAYHITAPREDGDGGFRAMEAALKDANITPDQIDYINAHGTSTPLGDMLEFNSVRRLFGEDLGGASMSSTKSAIGHLLGAAGAVEGIYCILSLVNQEVPPTLNLDEREEGTEKVDLVPHEAKKRKVEFALSNSFGFGGTNASVVFKVFKN
ncbi:MAG: beta-ketoacyl-ACP synthase II [Rickettsiales bacterium]|jgi:3-oxoacyl-[acyl-carrier-protein] synthase II|nr:beta-ketoacyl-ACP synthase II [Rickettsiales bacterium]